MPRNGHISSGVPGLPKGCGRTALILPKWASPLLFLPRVVQAQRKRASSFALETKGQPLIALAKSLFVCFSAFVQGCKDSKEEELEELPQLKGRMAAEAGERKLMEIRGGTVGEASVSSLPQPRSLRGPRV